MNIIKCKFCNYTVPRYYTTDDGRKKHGYYLLLNHIEDKHSEEWEEIRKTIEAEE